MRVFHKSLNVARDTRLPCVLLSDLITPVGQDRLKLWHLPSDPDLFVIRRSQTTDGETHIRTTEIAGETRSDARMASEGPALR